MIKKDLWLMEEEYGDVLKYKKESFRFINENQPLVIFMDGKNVTDNHKGYRMIGKDNFAETLLNCGIELIKEINTDAILLSGIDELTIIFQNPKDLINYIGVSDNANYIEAILMQKFVKKFWNYYNCFFKHTMFNIKQEDVEKFITCRKRTTYCCGLWYIAKEYLSFDEYRGLDINELEELLRQKKLLFNITKYPYLFKGYEFIYKKNDLDILDVIDIDSL